MESTSVSRTTLIVSGILIILLSFGAGILGSLIFSGGSAGAEGPAGPAGATGEKGPAGPSGASARRLNRGEYSYSGAASGPAECHIICCWCGIWMPS